MTGGGASVTGMPTAPIGVSNRNYANKQTAISPFGLRMDARLTYGVDVSIGTPGSLPTANKYRFRLNGAYDPDVTGTGHQPYQWDQLITIYTKYIVRGVYVDLTFQNPSTSGLLVGWSFHTDTTSNDDPQGKQVSDLMERPNFVCLPISTQGTQMVTCRLNIPVNKVFGLSVAQYLSVTDQYGAAYNAVPLSQAYLDLFVVDPNSTAASYIRVVGRLVYDIQFFDYAAPSAS